MFYSIKKKLIIVETEAKLPDITDKLKVLCFIDNAYISHIGLLNVWAFYTLLENAGKDIITLFTNTLTQLHIFCVCHADYHV